MNNASQRLSDEEVLLAFAVEVDQDPATLRRYMESYPHLATELLDLALDLELSLVTEPSPDDDPNSPALQNSWALFSRLLAEPAFVLSADHVKQIDASLSSPSMRQIGLPVSALRAIKSGMAELEGFPARWIDRISSAGGYAADAFRSYLNRPPSLSSSVSYKSDGKPQAGGKVAFGKLIEDSDLTDEQKSEILRED